MANEIGIQDSFNNVKIICHNALMKREEWLAVEQSLENISKALQAGIAAAAKVELLEKQIAESDKKKEEPDEEVVE